MTGLNALPDAIMPYFESPTSQQNNVDKRQTLVDL
jgi:hypothetical protein